MCFALVSNPGKKCSAFEPYRTASSDAWRDSAWIRTSDLLHDKLLLKEATSDLQSASKWPSLEQCMWTIGMVER
jgi:hypothetical protein